MAVTLIGPRFGYAHEAITVDNTSGGKSLTASNYRQTLIGNNVVQNRDAERALITVETDQIRWTYDGTAPTSTVGHLAEAGDAIELLGYENIVKFRAIRVTNNATIRVTYDRTS